MDVLQGTLLDEAAGVRAKEAELVVVSKTPKQPTSGGWNKVSISSYNHNIIDIIVSISQVLLCALAFLYMIFYGTI